MDADGLEGAIRQRRGRVFVVEADRWRAELEGEHSDHRRCNLPGGRAAHGFGVGAVRPTWSWWLEDGSRRVGRPSKRFLRCSGGLDWLPSRTGPSISARHSLWSASPSRPTGQLHSSEGWDNYPGSGTCWPSAANRTAIGAEVALLGDAGRAPKEDARVAEEYPMGEMVRRLRIRRPKTHRAVRFAMR